MIEVVKKDEKKLISQLIEYLNLGEITNIKRFKSNQNKVYKVEIGIKTYVVKQYSKDAIRNIYDLNKRKLQISVSEKLLENNINTIVPLKYKNRYFIKFKGDYYLLFYYYNYETLKPKDISEKEITKLAQTLANIHKLNLRVNLPCQYKKIKIDLDQYLQEYKNIDKKLYNTLKENYNNLKNLIDECNNSLKYVKQNLCISHNDYKVLNMLWNNDEMYLLDFDAVAMSNPYVSLAEAAFVYSKQNKVINKEIYKMFLMRYFEIIETHDIDYKLILNVAMNGKLQWLSYIMGQCSTGNISKVNDVIKMIENLIVYYINKNDLYNIYVELKKNISKNTE